MILNYNNEIIHIEVVRSKRTTLCISIQKDGSVLIKAPLFLDEYKIREILEKKTEWILEKRKEVHQQQSRKITRTYENGATLPYMGQEYPMEILSGRKSSVCFDNDRMVLTLQSGTNEEEIPALLKKWYKKQTLEIVNKRVKCYASLMGVTYGNISIKSRKKQWGTCDSNGDLTFSWRLSMASIEAIDYVVVHELCHRHHMDHSKQFWGQVKNVLPDYKQRQKWLEEHSVNMEL